LKNDYRPACYGKSLDHFARSSIWGRSDPGANGEM
jgi:hypothetical protein